MHDDEKWLRHTFQLAERSVELGDYAFGAALVGPGDELLLESVQGVARSGDWLAHAEMSVLREATQRWRRAEIASDLLQQHRTLPNVLGRDRLEREPAGLRTLSGRDVPAVLAGEFAATVR